MPECRGLGFGAKQAKQPVSGLAALSKCLWTYAEGLGQEFFCPWRGMSGMLPLTDALQEECIVCPQVP